MMQTGARLLTELPMRCSSKSQVLNFFLAANQARIRTSIFQMNLQGSKRGWNGPIQGNQRKILTKKNSRIRPTKFSYPSPMRMRQRKLIDDIQQDTRSLKSKSLRFLRKYRFHEQLSKESQETSDSILNMMTQCNPRKTWGNRRQ